MSTDVVEQKFYTNLADLKNARLIQQGMLPKPRHFNRLFQDWFVIFKPQNIISGDFYWVGEKHGLQYLVVGDCTGHGISAALLSILAVNLFEHTIMNKGIKKTNRILQEVDKKFIESFKDSSENTFDNPWIDLSIICVDKSNQKIYFSSANRKIVQVSQNKASKIFKGSRYPIGGWQLEENRTFDSQVIDYEKGDAIYLGSDGYQDQIGGPDKRKFKSRKLHELLTDISSHKMLEQKEILENQFNEWKGDHFQVDDVCLVGLLM